MMMTKILAILSTGAFRYPVFSSEIYTKEIADILEHIDQ